MRKNIQDKELWRQKYIDKNTKVLVAVSGWPDSMYLLYVLKNFFTEQGYPSDHLHVISGDHRTRTETQEEMHTVQKYSHPHPWQCIQYQGEKTTEDAFRQRRHQEFVDYAKKESIWLLFLGHHLDDRIETTILSLQQWCGYSGFRGIKRYDKHFLDPTLFIVRPLLSHTKEQIYKECKTYHIPYHIDPSNDDIHTSQRNKVRKYIHLLSEENNFKKSWQKIYEHLDAEVEEKSNNGNNLMLWSYHYLPSYESNTWILHIPPLWRNDDILYLLYHKHGKTIRPRAQTLTRLAEQLRQSNASISYQWLSIQTRKYISIVKVIS